jgi:hypothetical protein
MASIDWPALPFPQVPMHQGYAQREQSAVIRSQMGYGPAKMRRRTTAAIQPVNASMVLNDTNKATLITFYTATTEGGSVRFNWIDFLNDPDAITNDVEYRFTSPIQWSSRGPNLWLAVMNLEILP